MQSQKEIFKAKEADEWFNRNKQIGDDENKDDFIVKTLGEIEVSPKQILEVGCANGARLDKLHKVFDAKCFGIDPSNKAIEDGISKYPDISLQTGTADILPFDDNQFDLIVFGFCLYLCDRSDLFKIACEADRCLSNQGYLVILDFYPPFPYKNEYIHREGVYSYKMDYSKLFSWNPAYNQVYNIVFSHSGFNQKNIPNEKVALTILSKEELFAYPLCPYT